MKNLVKLDHHALVKKLAWEVARNVVDHNKNVYSKIFDNAPSTFAISLRNGIYNQISSAIECRTDADIQKWIARSDTHRKEMQRLRRLQKKASAANGNKEKIEEIMKELHKP